MVSRHEWQTVVDRVVDAWGNGAADWRNANKAYLHHQHLLRDVPAATVLNAVDRYVAEGSKWAPRIPELIARVRAGSDRPVRPDPSACDHPRLAAVSDRLMICAVCLREFIVEPREGSQKPVSSRRSEDTAVSEGGS